MNYLTPGELQEIKRGFIRNEFKGTKYVVKYLCTNLVDKVNYVKVIINELVACSSLPEVELIDEG